MAGYDYNYRSGYSNGMGVGAHLNEWGKTIYADDECRTVIVDADGTQRTIIGCTPLHKPGSYVTTAETIIRGRPPAFRHSSPPSSPVKGYGYAADDHKLRRPSSPVKGYGYAADDHKLRRPSNPVKGYGYAADDYKLHRPSSPVKGYGYAADDYPSDGVNWRQPPQQTWPSGSTGYGDYGDYKNKTLHNPNGNTSRNENYYQDQARRVTTIRAPQPGREGRLTSATDDMETALRYLKESVKSSSPPPGYPALKQDEYRTNAAKKNVRFNVPSWP